ncbi:MAG: radical SAM protein [archaeon]
MNCLRLAWGVIKHRVVKHKTPLSISWALTNRCNKRCSYCSVGKTPARELATEEVLNGIRVARELGCQRIGFTGGEPLLRQDIGKIISCCKRLGIFTGVVTNGSLVGEMSAALRELDLLQLSLDGDPVTNDSQRFRGSYACTIKAIRIARKMGIRVFLTCTLTRKTVGKVGHVLDTASEHDVPVFFQPVASYDICGKGAAELAPDDRDYRAAIKKLRGHKHVANSKTGLSLMLGWPEKRRMRCHAGELFCHIYTDGRMFPCFNMDNKNGIDIRNGFREAFTAISRQGCSCCYTYANVELNLALSLNPGSVRNAMRLLG